MSRILASSPRWRIPVQAGVGICAAYALQRRQNGMMRMDALPGGVGAGTVNAPPGQRVQVEAPSWLNPDFVKDVSQGSIFGFGTGAVVGFFSQALVVLTGMAMFALHIAQRWGMDLHAQARLRKWLGKTVLDKPFSNVVFRLSFTTTFVLAAFVRF